VTPRNHHSGTLLGLTATIPVTLRDRCQGSDFASLSGNTGHRVIFGAQRSVAIGRVEMWRGGFRLNISVAASFVRRCLSGSAVTPFPHPAHRTGRADFPHPALGQDITPLLSRATPSAAFEHQSELIGCPISKFFAT